MGKFFLFSLLFWLTGNPFLAIILLLVILYLVDLRYVRLLPNWFRPIQLNNRLSKLKQSLKVNPHDTSAKLETARIYMEKKQYDQALTYLEGIKETLHDSAEFLADYGISLLKTGRIAEGEEQIRLALARNPRVKYGEPFLHLSQAFAHRDTAKALSYLESLKQLHSSSVELFYRMGQLYLELQRKDEAKAAFREAIEVYNGLPKYKKRQERRWALLSRMK
ncbi:tetratricopeptide repeat protein [Brevibacillus fulvus]|uniref:Tetratricopeptide (TPR) repeat protein n=1 Tax=Brevibacillus fulvus TaxID=1125967 RepID=A0A939BSU5_9BACL|nr:tetratricopeptide repeat protein [Brevibacillus fulvus]MBM7591107.1 tetratricopeptide (TPR) repeat protein [Brevibacillus fulvus]